MTTLHEAAQKALELCERIRDEREVWSMGELRSVCLNLRSALAQQPALSTASKSEQLLASHEHALRAEFQRMKAALAQQGEPDYNICPSCGGMASDPCVPIKARFPQQGQQQPVAWQGVDLDGMVEALERVTEAQGARTPFHQPMYADARLAMRELRGLVMHMKRYAGAAPAAQPLTVVSSYKCDLDAARREEKEKSEAWLKQHGI